MESPLHRCAAFGRILPPPLAEHLRAVVALAAEGRGGDADVVAAIRDLPVREDERRLLRVGYALWRGYGPAVAVQDLAGMDEDAAAVLLAGLACAVRPDRAAAMLRRAAAAIERATPAPTEDLPTDERPTEDVPPARAAGS